jgi:catechol 2,3-dioxygenase-like lactoylglutathione lyase family enzyme
VARGSIHHLGLTVRDIQRSEAAFYAPVLSFLGYERVEGPSSHVSFWRDGKRGPTIHLVRAASEARPPEADHCAFSLESRRAVDELHQMLVEAKIEVMSPPAEYAQFGEGHYAVFFRDPDGRLFEALHRPPAAAAS